MCTVTIVPRGSEFRLMCNRDERRERPAALPPAVQSFGRIHATFPTDPQGGGTWIGVNSAGLAAVLLNRAETATQAGGASAARFSRGLIVPPLLGWPSLCTALREAQRVNPRQFAPFRLVLVHARTCAVVASNGRSLSVSAYSFERPLMFTSSSLGDEVVTGPRQAAFEQHVLSRGDADEWLAGQRHFHEHQWPDRPHVSVLMSRSDARTVSRTVVDVSPWFVRLDYEPIDPVAPRRVVAVGRAA